MGKRKIVDPARSAVKALPRELWLAWEAKAAVSHAVTEGGLVSALKHQVFTPRGCSNKA